MMQSRILASGNFQQDKVIVTVVEQSNRATNDSIETQIDTLWEETLAQAKTSGKLAYDGDLFRLESATVTSEGILDLKISRIKFRTFNGLKKILPNFENFGEEYYSKCIAIGGFVRTLDGKYIFGRRSGKTLAIQNEDFIGGLLERDINNSEDLFLMNKQEILEEINVQEFQITSTYLKGIVLSHSGTVIFLTNTKLNIESDELIRNFELNNDKLELSELVVVEENDLSEYLESLNGYKQVIVDSLNSKQLKLS